MLLAVGLVLYLALAALEIQQHLPAGCLQQFESVCDKARSLNVGNC